jgi:parallel beta-helix repeat protein
MKITVTTLTSLEEKLQNLEEKVDNLEIYFPSGEYSFDKPLLIDKQLANTIKITGDNATINGATRLKGFKEETVNGINMWTLEIPEVKSGEWDFRELFVNSNRANRTRLPKNGHYWIEDVKEIDRTKNFWLDFCKNHTSFNFKQGDFLGFINPTDVEVVIEHFWVDERMSVKNIDTQNRLVEFSNKTFLILMDEKDDCFAKYFIENTFEGLSEEGEFYLDKSKGKLFYIPRADESINTAEVYAPKTSQFIKVIGESKNSNYIENIEISNLKFKFSNWYHPNPTSFDNFNDYENPVLDKDFIPYGAAAQAEIHVPGTIYFEGVKNSKITNCEISHFGFYAIELYQGCSNVEILDNRIFDGGAGGVKISGNNDSQLEQYHTHSNKISNNEIFDLGKIFKAGIGVFLGHSYKNKIINNHIHDLFYTGISSGWVWGFNPSVSNRNLIKGNYIHDIGKGELSDMGGIYILGMQPGTIISENCIHSVAGHKYGGHGIYLDEGSSFVVVENNLVYDTTSPTFFLHYGRENIVRNNIFIGSSRDCCYMIGKYQANQEYNEIQSECKMSVILYNNIFISNFLSHFVNSNEHINTPIYQCFCNAYFSNLTDFATIIDIDEKLSFNDWQQLGFDIGSILSKDQVEIVGKTYKLDKNSPAYKVGFKDFDVSLAGQKESTEI